MSAPRILCGWALLFSCTAAPAAPDGAVPGLLPLTPADLQAARPAACTAAVLATAPDGAPRTVLKIGDGAQAWARFAGLAGGAARAPLEERPVWLVRSGREKSAGRFRVVYSGALPADIDPLAFQTYRVTLLLEPAGSCAARGAVPCRRYSGTLQAEYRFRGFGKEVPTVAAPALAVQLNEWCAKDDYRYYGMFAFPSWLDKAGELLLRSR
ncbi:MAG: hypothetical protein AB1807_20820 [Pseudomonadota bacterium]